jgi:hypothetical protein
MDLQHTKSHPEIEKAASQGWAGDRDSPPVKCRQKPESWRSLVWFQMSHQLSKVLQTSVDIRKTTNFTSSHIRFLPPFNMHFFLNTWMLGRNTTPQWRAKFIRHHAPSNGLPAHAKRGSAWAGVVDC